MQINLLQIKVEQSPELNIEKVISLTKNNRNQIFVLPELFTTGFNYEHIKKHVDSQPLLLERLPEENIYIGSIVRKINNNIYNSFFIKNGKNINFTYNKIHLFPLMDEDKHFNSGKKIATFKLDDYNCGCAICFDLRFPELFRKYFLEKVDIIFTPMQWPYSRISQMIPLAQARAIENQCYIVICNAVGDIWDAYFGGHSMIISPLGEILVSGNLEIDKILSTQIDKNIIKEFRKSMPIDECIKLM